jgi:hypothetical protein
MNLKYIIIFTCFFFAFLSSSAKANDDGTLPEQGTLPPVCTDIEECYVIVEKQEVGTYSFFTIYYKIDLEGHPYKIKINHKYGTMEFVSNLYGFNSRVLDTYEDFFVGIYATVDGEELLIKAVPWSISYATPTCITYLHRINPNNVKVVKIAYGHGMRAFQPGYGFVNFAPGINFGQYRGVSIPGAEPHFYFGDSIKSIDCLYLGFALFPDRDNPSVNYLPLINQ